MILNNMEEIWRKIKNYQNYEISNLGRARSLNCGRERILKTRKHPSGYELINIKGKTYKIHKLVAEAFIPNPYDYKEINHKDEDKLNNRVDNLEWCNRKYNCNYGSLPKKVAERFSKPVFLIDIKSELKPMMFFESAMQAERLFGIDHSSIIKCCRGKVKTAGGYEWHYLNKDLGGDDLSHTNQINKENIFTPI